MNIFKGGIIAANEIELPKHDNNNNNNNNELNNELNNKWNNKNNDDNRQIATGG